MARRADARWSRSAVPGSTGSLRAALALLLVGAALVCVLEVALLAYPYPDVVWILATLTFASMLYVVAGVLAWDRRPSNRMGMWLVIAGFLGLLARLSNVEEPVLSTIGQVLAQAPIVAVLHLMFLFPSGVLARLLDRVLVVLAYAVGIGFAVPQMLFRAADLAGAPRFAERPDLAELFARLQQVCWLTVLAVSLVVLVRRMRGHRAVPGEWRARIAVYVAGFSSIVLLPLVAQIGPLLGWDVFTVFLLQVTLVALVPAVFVGSLLIGGFARTGALDELAAWLGGFDGDRRSLEAALARTLGDASLEVLYASAAGRFVGSDGREAEPPAPAAPAGVVPVELRGERVGLIVYDTHAIADPRLVQAAAKVVTVALDRERLTEELRAERDALRRSRTRIVEVGDVERRRLARDLHDGLQSRLVLAAMRAGTIAITDAPDSVRRSAERLREDLEQSVDELRRLVHGVMPALLLERGLTAAARELVERCGIPSDLRLPLSDPDIPPAVATTAYFVLAEAITNAVKHSRAHRLVVALELDDHTLRLTVADDGVGAHAPSGVGLRGMADRVEALQGTLVVDSRPGSGTTVRADIPSATPGSVAA